jgi:hypothetical protein
LPVGGQQLEAATQTQAPKVAAPSSGPNPVPAKEAADVVPPEDQAAKDSLEKTQIDNIGQHPVDQSQGVALNVADISQKVKTNDVAAVSSSVRRSFTSNQPVTGDAVDEIANSLGIPVANVAPKVDAQVAQMPAVPTPQAEQNVAADQVKVQAGTPAQQSPLTPKMGELNPAEKQAIDQGINRDKETYDKVMSIYSDKGRLEQARSELQDSGIDVSKMSDLDVADYKVRNEKQVVESAKKVKEANDLQTMQNYLKRKGVGNVDSLSASNIKRIYESEYEREFGVKPPGMSSADVEPETQKPIVETESDKKVLGDVINEQSKTRATRNNQPVP